MGQFGSMFSERFGDILKIIFFLFAVRAVMLLTNLGFGHFPIIDPALNFIWHLIGVAITEFQKSFGWSFF